MTETEIATLAIERLARNDMAVVVSLHASSDQPEREGNDMAHSTRMLNDRHLNTKGTRDDREQEISLCVLRARLPLRSGGRV